MRQVETAYVIGNTPVAQGIYRMTLRAPEIVRKCRTGQFVDMEVVGDGSRILKRPISISSIDKDRGAMDLIVQVVGGGTRCICDIAAGEAIRLVGPLGNGFLQFEDKESLWLIGGGVGIAPLLMAAQRYRAKNPGGRLRVFLGYACKSKAYYQTAFDPYADAVDIATEDGSLGEKGYVIAAMERALDAGAPALVLACGPTPMLTAVQRLVNPRGIPCLLSLEARMGCGIGVCLGCVVKIGSPDHWEYKRVCMNGPVFDSREVMLDE